MYRAAVLACLLHCVSGYVAPQEYLSKDFHAEDSNPEGSLTTLLLAVNPSFARLQTLKASTDRTMQDVSMKALRKYEKVNRRNRKYNYYYRSTMKTRMRKVLRECRPDEDGKLVGNLTTIQTELLPAAYKALDKNVKRGIVHKNYAARMKSKLARTVNTLDTKYTAPAYEEQVLKMLVKKGAKYYPEEVAEADSVEEWAKEKVRLLEDKPAESYKQADGIWRAYGPEELAAKEKRRKGILAQWEEKVFRENARRSAWEQNWRQENGRNTVGGTDESVHVTKDEKAIKDMITKSWRSKLNKWRHLQTKGFKDSVKLAKAKGKKAKPNYR